MTDGVQSLDGKVPWRHLVGLEHRLKDEDRVKARIAEDIRVKGRTVDQAFATLGDAIRFTFQYPEDRYTEGVLGDLGQLAAQGFTEVRRVNFWTRPGEHKGIVSCWREPESGVLLEVQFHTRPSYEAWQLTHPASERLRHPRTSDAERADLKVFLRKVYDVFGPQPASPPGGPAGGIAGKVTCYAIVDVLSSREEPAGLLRRIEHEGGQRDEAFGYDLAWRPTFLLYSAERGNLDNTMHQIGEDEADRIQARIRRSRTAEQM
jgi:hypothetical protein